MYIVAYTLYVVCQQMEQDHFSKVYIHACTILSPTFQPNFGMSISNTHQ